jgi:hypothetical protein
VRRARDRRPPAGPRRSARALAEETRERFLREIVRRVRSTARRGAPVPPIRQGGVRAGVAWWPPSAAGRGQSDAAPPRQPRPRATDPIGEPGDDPTDAAAGAAPDARPADAPPAGDAPADEAPADGASPELVGAQATPHRHTVFSAATG